MRRVLLMVPVLLVALCLVRPADAAGSAYVTWACDPTMGATDSLGAYLMGNKTTTLNFSTGALVQLVKMVGGDIDGWDPLTGLHPDLARAASTGAGLIDDVLLQEATIGYRILGSGSASGRFSVVNDAMDLTSDDVGVSQLYVRAFNMPKDQLDTTALGTLEAGVSSFQTVMDVMNPQVYFFNNIETMPVVPEPASLLLLVPGLAIWAIRRKK